MSEPLPRNNDVPSDAGVPKAVVSRLSLYLRELLQLMRDGTETISSTLLGGRIGVSDAQIRKDLAYFGQFGYPGIGYRCPELVAKIRQILGTDREWRVALVGVGNLGTALLGYRGFDRQGFQIVAAFDVDNRKNHRRGGGIVVYPMDRLEDVVRRESIKLGIIAVPATEAQTVADRLVSAGVEGLMNFAPVTLNIPPNIRQSAVDLAIELEQLSFAVVNRGETSYDESSSSLRG